MLPVEQVSWDNAQAFIKALNRITSKTYRLPSEAEWEYAAKGGKQSKGYRFAGSDYLPEVAWYWENSGEQRLSGEWVGYNELDQNYCRTHPVGQKKPNELGLFDMSGNVSEWCQDTWHNNLKGAPSNGDAWTKGEGPERIIRGGSWNEEIEWCRSAQRSLSPPQYGNNNIGFRLALG